MTKSSYRWGPGTITLSSMDQVSFVHMDQGTKEEFQFLKPLFANHAHSVLVDNLLGMLKMLQGPKLGYQVDRYEHSLQSATRAYRKDEPTEMVVAALLHDVADSFAPENHSDAAAALLEPYVGEETHWIVKHHGLFQGYYYFHHMGGDRNARDLYGDSPYFDACANFCAEYDQNCFDPAYDTLPIEEFEPMVREIFGRPSRVPGVPLPVEA